MFVHKGGTFLFKYFITHFSSIFFLSFVLYVSEGGTFHPKANFMEGLWLKEEHSALSNLHPTFVHKE